MVEARDVRGGKITPEPPEEGLAQRHPRTR